VKKKDFSYLLTTIGWFLNLILIPYWRS